MARNAGSVVSAIYAGYVVRDLERASRWFEAIFERAADAAPMDGLLEWHLEKHRLQVVSLEMVRDVQQIPDWGSPGSSSLTLAVDDASAAAARAVAAGGRQVSSFEGPSFSTASVSDAEGNLVTFLQFAGA